MSDLVSARSAAALEPGRAESGSAERGSASIWLLGLAALVLSVTLIVLIQATALLGRHRLERSSDLAALAAAGQLGTGGDPCRTAARIANANAAVLEGCLATLDPGGRSGTVAVRLRGRITLALLGARWVHARSRAGRLVPAARDRPGAQLATVRPTPPESAGDTAVVRRAVPVSSPAAPRGCCRPDP